MFTGIVEEIGKIKKYEKSGTGILLSVSCEKILTDMKIGDSISINGVCQTVVEFTNYDFTVFVSNVTTKITTLGNMKINQFVNLERAMSVGSRFGGHMVQGHVDGVATVENVKKDASGMNIEINVSQNITKYIVDKGSITIDGTSLTVVNINGQKVTLYIIPETINSTILRDIQKNNSVNVEIDIIAKYVEKMLPLKNSTFDEKSDEALKEKIIKGGF